MFLSRVFCRIPKRRRGWAGRRERAGLIPFDDIRHSRETEHVSRRGVETEGTTEISAQRVTPPRTSQRCRPPSG